MTAARALAGLAAFATVACGLFGETEEPPQFLGYEIVEGEPACPGCPLTGPRLGPDASGTLTFRYDARYTVRTVVRTAGGKNRCIYHMVWYSWKLTNHEFNCMPERGTHLEMDTPITTEFFILRGYPGPHRLDIELAEYDSETRQELSRQRIHSFPIQFAP